MTIAQPRISMPSGGGATRGMGEAFAANAFSGAATFALPIPVSAARGLEPELQLTYSSFEGNGPFGIGFTISLGEIRRSAALGVPRYRDDDAFTLDGDALAESGRRTAQRGGVPYDVTRYRRRVEGAFDRIERWAPRDGSPAFWSVTTTENVTTLYGTSGGSRIADPAEPARVAAWLCALTYDARGNAVRSAYKREDLANVAPRVYELGRVQTANLYPERICYGNATPFGAGDDADDPAWLFEIVFDYGEREIGIAVDDPYTPVRAWHARPDAFSSYELGFERRTHRLCRNVLMFHRFAELGDAPVLVHQTRFTYDESADVSRLNAVESIGYRATVGAPPGERYAREALPPLRFAFTPFVPAREGWHALATSDGGELVGDRRDVTAYADLYGDGLPGIVYAGESALRYARPALDSSGEVRYAAEPPQRLPVLRDTGGTLDFADLTGDGRLDALFFSAVEAGFAPNDGGGFGTFVPFEGIPLAFGANRAEAADLSARGSVDLVLVDERSVQYVPSLGARGYGSAVAAPRNNDVPVSAPASDAELRGFAPLLAGGNACSVRVRSGTVECWPSLGYGAFGEKVTLDGAPSFEAFDPGRIRFVDVDGSGLADLAYVFADRIAIYRNLAGNRFASEPLVVGLPEAGPPERVAFVDVDGTGCDAVVCARPRPAERLAYRFVPRGGKPYLLASVDNSSGARTAIRYESSARYALEERRAGRVSPVTLPFPVQLVAEVETHDAISQTVATASYRYRHGYYDSVERAYRGFGMVESRNVGRAYASARNEDEPATPVTLTRRWFVTGAPDELAGRLDACYAREYFCGDPHAYAMPASAIAWLREPDAELRRQAAAALAGFELRSETYGLDGDPRSAVPYAVAEQNAAVRQVPASPACASFFVGERESIRYDYERDAADPRIAHAFVLRYTDLGAAERTAEIAYRRRPGRPGTLDAQRRTYATCTATAYVPARDDDAYLAGVASEARAYELLDLPAPSTDGYYRFAEIDAAVAAALAGPPEGDERARLLSWNRTLYAAEGGGVAPPGIIGAQALPLRSEDAALHDRTVRETFAPTPIARDLDGILGAEGGYRFDPATGLWWQPGPSLTYHGADAFYLTASCADPFVDGHAAERSGATLEYGYDAYGLALLAVGSVPSRADVLVLETRVTRFDYQALAPCAARDANGMTTQALYDPLGRAFATSWFGRELRDGVPVDVGFGDIAAWKSVRRPASLAELVATPETFLRDAATFMYYDAHAVSDGGQPQAVATLVAQQEPQNGEARGPIGIGITYADGVGRVVQETLRVEPAANGEQAWRVSGHVRYDERGSPFRRFEPALSPTYRFGAAGDERIAETLRHDALGRIVRVELPKGPFADAFFREDVYGAWDHASWDEDDTIARSRYYRYYVVEGHALPEEERAALVAAAAFADTPSRVRVDALGHPVERVALLATATGVEELVTAGAFDVNGRELWAADPRLHASGARNVETTYALGGSPLRIASADAGTRYGIDDAAGNPLVGIDARGYVVRRRYDSLQRRIALAVTTPDGTPVTTERTVYGDSVDAAGDTAYPLDARNAAGRPVVVYDTAGCERTPAYTPAGQGLSSEQRLTRAYDALVDWSGSASTWPALFERLDVRLEPETFVTAACYDVLGRATSTIDPGGNRWTGTYDVAGLPATLGLQAANEPHRTYVDVLAYNARGDRERVRYAAPDGAPLLETTYAYDPHDFRLAALRSRRLADGALVQDLRYWYDPAGNPTTVADAAAPVSRIVRNGQVVTASRELRYDSLYRLVSSTGRARSGYTRADLRTASYAPYFAPAHPHDAAAVERYTMTYEYDRGDNLTRLRYVAPSTQWTQTLSVEPGSNRATEDDGLRRAAAGAFDAAGNALVLEAIPQLRWDYRGALATATVIERDEDEPDAVYATYRGTGERVRKVVRTLADGGMRTEITLVFGPYELHRRYAGGVLSTEMRRLRLIDGDRCALERIDWTVGAPPRGAAALQHRYQLDDRLGSSVAELDGAGTPIAYEEYAPYGGTTYAGGTSLADVSVRAYRFCGKERDATTGLCYFGARYYAPWLGRWISPDPAGPVDGLNLYEYCASNPVAYVDPLGLAKKSATAPKPKKKKPSAQEQKLIKEAKADAVKLLGKGTTQLYQKLGALAKRARSGDQAAITAAKKLADRMQNDKAFRKEVAKRVRVKAKKPRGAKKGFGKDEIFQTAETAYAFQVSANLVPGMAPTAYYKNPSGTSEITLLDAQQLLRLDTSIVPSKEGEGHTGMFLVSKSGRGYLTTGQATFHQERTVAMKKQTTTKAAIIATLAQHVLSTANYADMQAKTKKGFTVAHQDMSNSVQREKVIDQNMRVRDTMKMVVTDFSEKLYEDTAATDLGTYQPPPLSPRHYSSPTGFPSWQQAMDLEGYANTALPTWLSTFND